MSTAIILAGGLGTRLRSEVPDLPKPMAPVNERPFLSYLMDYWIGQGVSRIVLSIGYKSHAIRDYYGDRYRHVELQYSVEEKPLGTGGGLLLALQQMQGGDDFLVLNGDTFFAVDLGVLMECHKHTGSDVTMALLDVAENDRYGGVSMDSNGRIASLDSSSGDAGSNRVNGGVYLMKRDLFDGCAVDGLRQGCSLEDDLFPAILKNGKNVSGYLSSGRFIDIGVPKDYRRASTLLMEEAQ
jgi:D-glycero-alpha-D-manno-heptose 1-phosphate guanylyltransferase